MATIGHSQQGNTRTEKEEVRGGNIETSKSKGWITKDSRGTKNHGRRHEVVAHCLLEDLEERVGKNSLWKVVPSTEVRNKRVEVCSEPGDAGEGQRTVPLNGSL